MFFPSRRISPSRREWRTVSCIRSSVRRRVDLPQPDGPMRAVTLLVAMPRLMSKRVCLAPYQKLTLEMVILISAGAAVSRLAPVVTGGVMLTDTADLTNAFMNNLPRNRNAAGQNRASNNIESQKNKTRGPSLAVPVLVRREAVVVDHDRKRGGGLGPATAPIAVT